MIRVWHVISPMVKNDISHTISINSKHVHLSINGLLHPNTVTFPMNVWQVSSVGWITWLFLREIYSTRNTISRWPSKVVEDLLKIILVHFLNPFGHEQVLPSIPTPGGPGDVPMPSAATGRLRVDLLAAEELIAADWSLGQHQQLTTFKHLLLGDINQQLATNLLEWWHNMVTLRRMCSIFFVTYRPVYINICILQYMIIYVHTCIIMILI